MMVLILHNLPCAGGRWIGHYIHEYCIYCRTSRFTTVLLYNNYALALWNYGELLRTRASNKARAFRVRTH